MVIKLLRFVLALPYHPSLSIATHLGRTNRPNTPDPNLEGTTYPSSESSSTLKTQAHRLEKGALSFATFRLEAA